MKEIIKEVLKRKLSDKQYHADSTSALTKEVADEIKARLKGTGLPPICVACHIACTIL